MGISRGTFGHNNSAVDDSGVEALFERDSRKSNLARQEEQCTESTKDNSFLGVAETQIRADQTCRTSLTNDRQKAATARIRSRLINMIQLSQRLARMEILVVP
ncbi:MAG: hypothetical protein KUG74_09700 [Rhodobacteraceae bacterium]|nr:hypothetical protein [Paracoccaceae bacterium]